MLTSKTKREYSCHLYSLVIIYQLHDLYVNKDNVLDVKSKIINVFRYTSPCITYLMNVFRKNESKCILSWSYCVIFLLGENDFQKRTNPSLTTLRGLSASNK